MAKRILRRALQLLAFIVLCVFMLARSLTMIVAAVAVLLLLLLVWRRYFNDGPSGYWPGKPIE